MTQPSPIRIERHGPVARVTLQRPEVHNAFDAATILALGAAFDALSADDGVRAVVLAGDGRSFSAGGDLRWMQASAARSPEENVDDVRVLARMLQKVDRCPKPVLARVQGMCLGGGTGLVSASDLVVCDSDAVFGFSEVRLGLLPGVISPFVVRRIGPARARFLMLTGERFGAPEALRYGLVDLVAPSDGLDETIAKKVGQLLKGGRRAQAAIKELVRTVEGREPEEVELETARSIAEARASAEGLEGVTAFLERREPSWRA